MDFPTALSQYGLAGTVIFALATVCALLYRDNKQLQQKVQDAQQARVEDAKEVEGKIIVPLELLGKTMNLVYDKLYDAKRNS